MLDFDVDDVDNSTILYFFLSAYHCYTSEELTNYYFKYEILNEMKTRSYNRNLYLVNCAFVHDIYLFILFIYLNAFIFTRMYNVDV